MVIVNFKKIEYENIVFIKYNTEIKTTLNNT